MKFLGNDIFGTLTEPCVGSGGGVIRQFYDSSGDYGVKVARDIAWGGRFMRVGGNAQWRNDVGLLTGGYLLHSIRRNNVDNILVNRGKPVVRYSQQLMLEAACKWQPNGSPFVRAQISSNLFFNDVPVTYNAGTSGSLAAATRSSRSACAPGFEPGHDGRAAAVPPLIHPRIVPVPAGPGWLTVA